MWYDIFMKLIKYIEDNTIRGPCCCGKCIDGVKDPETKQPSGHTADMIFFKVSAKETADANRLKELIQKHISGYTNVDLFDGKEHNYLEVGAWMGDQGLSLQLMGLGSILKLWTLMTPKTMLGDLPDELVMQMAGSGMISIKANK